MEVISYLGHPIRTRDAEIVGTICVIDRKRRQWREEDAAILADLASLAEAEIEAAQREPAALAPQAGLVADTVETDRIADLVERSQAALVARIGNIAILYRRSREKPLIALPKA